MGVRKWPQKSGRVQSLWQIASLVTVGALIVVAWVAVRGIAVSHHLATEAARADLAALEDAGELQTLLYQKGLASEYVLTGDSRWLEELSKTTGEFESWLQKITEFSRTQEASRVAAALSAEYGRYDMQRSRALAEYQRGDRDSALITLAANTERAAKLRDLAAALIHIRRQEVTDQTLRADGEFRRSLFALALAVTAAILGAAIVGYLVARQVSRLARQVEASSAELAEQERRLLQAEKVSALGEMATAVAHEVLNPLTGVKTAMQLLARLDLSPAVKETAAAVDSEINRVERIARKLISFARPVRAEVRPLELKEVVRRVVAATRHEAEAHEVAVEPRLNGVRTVEADPELLEQVLVNLIVNACQATQPGRKIWIEARGSGSRGFVIDVRDQGSGLAPEIATHLFTPFVTTKRGGHGLGLAISQNIMVSQGGRIEARSNAPEPGTTFSVFLPGGNS